MKWWQESEQWRSSEAVTVESEGIEIPPHLRHRYTWSKPIPCEMLPSGAVVSKRGWCALLSGVLYDAVMEPHRTKYTVTEVDKERGTITIARKP